MVFHTNSCHSDTDMRGKRNPTSGSQELLLPPCRVCGASGSGFHYGVTTCEACKGFFRRSFVRDSPYQCIKSRHCTIGPSTSRRQSCPKCRYNKCLAVGMSREAIKTGRYSLDKKCQDILELVEHKESNGLVVDNLKEKAQAAVEKSNKYKGRKRKSFENKDPAAKRRCESHHLNYRPPALPQWPQNSYSGNFATNGDTQPSQICSEFEMVADHFPFVPISAPVGDQASPDKMPVLSNMSVTPQQLTSSPNKFYPASDSGDVPPQPTDYKYTNTRYVDYGHGHFVHTDQRREQFESVGPQSVYSSSTSIVSNFTANNCSDTFIDPHEPHFLPIRMSQRSSCTEMFSDTSDEVSSFSQSPTLHRYSNYNDRYASDIHSNELLPYYKPDHNPHCMQSTHYTFQDDNFLQNSCDYNTDHKLHKTYDDVIDRHANTVVMGTDDLNPEGVIARTFLGSRWEDISTLQGHEGRRDDSNYDKFPDVVSNQILSPTHSLATGYSSTSSPFSPDIANSKQSLDSGDEDREPRSIKNGQKSECLKTFTSLDKELEGMTSSDKVKRIKDYMDDFSDSKDSSDVIIVACKLPELSRFRFSAYQSYPFVSYVSERVSPFLKNVIDISSIIDKNVFKLGGTTSVCTCAVCSQPQETMLSLEKAVMTPDRVCTAPWEQSEHVGSLINTEFGCEVARFIEAHYKLIGRHDIVMSKKEMEIAYEMYFDLVKLKKRMYGSAKLVPWDIYTHLLETKGIHADDRYRLLAIYVERFNESLPNVIRCCRFIPGFASLGTVDKMQLARDGVFKWQLLHSFQGYDTCIGLWLDSHNKWMLDTNEWSDAFPLFFVGLKRFEDVICELKTLNLAPEEIIIMKAITIMTPGRSYLHQRDRVEEMSAKLKLCLKEMMEKKHDNPEEMYNKVIDILDSLNHKCTLFLHEHDQARHVYGLVLKENEVHLYKELMQLT